MIRITRSLILVSLLFAASALSCVWRGDYFVFSRLPQFVPCATTGLGIIAAVPLVILINQARSYVATIQPRLFNLKPIDIPQKPGFTYVGKGFIWTYEHTRKLLELSSGGEIERLKKRFIKLSRFGSGHYVHGIGALEDGEQDLFIDNRLLSHHTLIAGTTGAGKTRLFELLILQAILRREPVIIIDPKGDPDRRLLRHVIDTCIQSGRMDDLRIFDLMTPRRSIRYNPLKNFIYPKQLVSRIVGSMPHEGEAASFRDFAAKVVNAVVHGIHALDMKITLSRIYKYSDDIGELVRSFFRAKYSGWFENIDRADVVRELIPSYERKVRDGLIQSSPELDEVIKIAKHPHEHLQKMVSNLFPLFSRLCTGPDAAMLSNDDPDQEELSWEMIDRRNMIAYIYLGANTDVDRATAVGRMMLSDMQSYLGTKYAYSESESFNPINIFVSEAHALLVPEFISVLNQARGAGFRLFLETQSYSDFEHILRSRAAQERILANINNIFQLHVEQQKDAEVFASRCGERMIGLTQTSVGYEPGILRSGRHEVEDFRSSESRTQIMKEVSLISSDWIQELPVGHAFARWGALVHKLIFPYLDEPETSERDLNAIEFGRVNRAKLELS